MGIKRKYEFIEHTADIGVRAFGDSLAESFAGAAEAMFDIITDGAVIKTELQVDISLEASDSEELLVRFLSQLIVVHETDNLVLSGFEIDISENNRLVATIKGEKFVDERHGGGTQVKGVSFHMLKIVPKQGDQPGWVEVLFDV